MQPRFFLARDARMTQAIVSTMTRKLKTETQETQFSLPLHPFSASAQALGNTTCRSLETGMACELGPSPPARLPGPCSHRTAPDWSPDLASFLRLTPMKRIPPHPCYLLPFPPFYAIIIPTYYANTLFLESIQQTATTEPVHSQSCHRESRSGETGHRLAVENHSRATCQTTTGLFSPRGCGISLHSRPV
jgi:hypothetical protein